MFVYLPDRSGSNTTAGTAFALCVVLFLFSGGNNRIGAHSILLVVDLCL